jgi:predicted NBD/HSP70 family sugar kinase
VSNKPPGRTPAETTGLGSVSSIDEGRGAVRLGPLPDKADQTTVRQHNLSLVLRLLNQQGPRSRAGISERTNLTKATVSSLISELLDLHLLHELGEQQSGRPGRPATLVEVSSERVALGLEIDVDYVAACALDLGGRVHAREVIACDNTRGDWGAAIDRLEAAWTPVLDQLAGSQRRPIGAAVAVPGLIDPVSRGVVVAGNLNWTDVPVADAIGTRLGMAIGIDNEANLAARAELAMGWGSRWRDFIFVSGGVGVGAGVVVGGHLFSGAHGFGGELGHAILDPTGPTCTCGNRGCVEQYVGMNSLPEVLGQVDDPTWPDSIVAAAQSGDRNVLAALDEVAAHLAGGLVSAVNLFDPEAVILGGYLAPLSQWMAGTVSGRLNRDVLGSRWANYQVVPSRMGREASTLGAGVLVIEEVLNDPHAVEWAA